MQKICRKKPKVDYYKKFFLDFRLILIIKISVFGRDTEEAINPAPVILIPNRYPVFDSELVLTILPFEGGTGGIFFQAVFSFKGFPKK